MSHLRPTIPLLVAGLAACDPPPDAAGDTGDTGCPPLGEAASAEWSALYGRVFDGAATDCDLERLAAWVEGQREAEGAQPWDTAIRIAVAPPDGPFEALEGDVVTRAGVPEAVRDDDGRTWLFHVDGDLDRLLEEANARSDWFRTHGWVGQGALNLLVSDDGRTFEPEPAFGVEGIVRGMVVDPDVIRLPDGTWRMYYVGMTFEEYFSGSEAWAPGTRHLVFSASSTDLVHWVQDGEVFRGPYADPTVRCWDERTCLMASFGIDRSASTDGGLNFEFQDQDDPPGFGPEFTDLPDGRTRLWYNSTEGGAPLWSLITEDRGETWVAEDRTWLPGYGEAPGVIADPDGTLTMYYHTFMDPSDIPEDGAAAVRARALGRGAARVLSWPGAEPSASPERSLP